MGNNRIEGGEYWHSHTCTEWLYDHKDVWCLVDRLLDETDIINGDIVDYMANEVDEAYSTGELTYLLIYGYIKESNGSEVTEYDDLIGGI